MLLVQITINGTVHYVSDDFLDIEHFYEAKVASLGNLRVETSQPYGGFAAPTYGDLELLPDLFAAADWPPPARCAVKVYIGDTGEAGAYLVFDGTAYLNTIARDGVTYSLYGNSITTDAAADQIYSGTLNAVFTTACATLGLTLNTTYARATPPTVYYQVSGITKILDNLTVIAESFSHRFYIQAGTLYLVDTLLDNGTTLALTEFDIFPSSYTMPSPVKEVTARYKGTPIYIGLFISATPSSLASIAELKFYDEAGEAVTNTAAGATSEYSTLVASNSRDGNLATRWASATPPSATNIQGIWGQPGVLGAASGYGVVAPQTNFLTDSPMTWVLKGYDSSVGQWAEIGTEKQTTAWTSNEERKFSIGDLYYDVRVTGSSSFGESLEISPVASDVYATILTCITDIKTTMERPRIEIAIPLKASTMPRIGQKITLYDESLMHATTVWARVSALVLDFDNDQCVIEGEGGLS